MMGYNKGYKLGYREAYFFGKPYKNLSPEQKELKDKLISAFRNYKSDLADLKNNNILLNEDLLSFKEKELLIRKNKLIKLRLMYLDNLIDPLVRKDKEIIYYKYIEGLTNAKIVSIMPYYGDISSINSRASRILGILTLRTNPLIFRGDN